MVAFSTNHSIWYAVGLLYKRPSLLYTATTSTSRRPCPARAGGRGSSGRTSASSGCTLRKCRMSHLLPTIVTAVWGSAWSRSSFSHLSQCSNVTARTHGRHHRHHHHRTVTQGGATTSVTSHACIADHTALPRQNVRTSAPWLTSAAAACQQSVHDCMPRLGVEQHCPPQSSMRAV